MTQVVNRKGEAAIALVCAGASYAEVARVLEFGSETRAREVVEAQLGKLATDDDRRKHRALASARYERLLLAIWMKATDHRNPEQLPAVRQAREIVDRIVNLQGAAVPQEIIVHTPTTAQLLAWVQKVTSVAMPPVEEADVFELPGEVVDAEVLADVPSTHDGQA